VEHSNVISLAHEFVREESALFFDVLEAGVLRVEDARGAGEGVHGTWRRVLVLRWGVDARDCFAERGLESLELFRDVADEREEALALAVGAVPAAIGAPHPHLLFVQQQCLRLNVAERLVHFVLVPFDRFDLAHE